MITVTALTKKYGSHTAVENISFTCPPGTVTGFLGPNGAGKTTTLRVLTGLTIPTHGTATIDGHRYRDIPNPATQIGVMLDASAQHVGRTGREVLRLGATAMGLPRGRVEETLRIVGLKPKEARQRIRGYSLGMRQRLGIAHALLGDPRVLILDEPANGLDPAGIRWLRNLVADFARRGGTVLLSTHLLSDIEAVADHLVIIGDGRILAAGATGRLLDGERLEDFYLGLTAGTQRDVDEEALDFSAAVAKPVGTAFAGTGPVRTGPVTIEPISAGRRQPLRPYRAGLR
jgi:ABC-2 type transport system ATP-binding protein